MAQIKISQRENILKPQRIVDNADIAGAGKAGRQVAKVGNKLGAVEQVFNEKVRQAQNTSDVSERMVNLMTSQSEFITKRAQDTDANGTFLEDFDKKQKELSAIAIDGITDPDANRVLTEKIKTFFARQRVSATQLQRKQQVETIKNNGLVSIDKFKTLAFDANVKDLPGIIKQANETIAGLKASGAISEAQAEQRFEKFNTEVQVGRMTRLLQTNPAAALELLKKKSLPFFTPEKHLSMKQQAKSLTKQRNSVSLQATANLARDMMARVSETGKVDSDQFNAVLKRLASRPKIQKKFITEMNLEKVLFDNKETMNAMTPEESAKFIRTQVNKLKNSGTDGFFKMKQGVVKMAQHHNRLIKEMDEDPVARLEKHPLIKNLTTDAGDTISEATGIPKKDLPLGLGDKTGAANTVVQAVTDAITGGNALEDKKMETLLSLQKQMKVPKQKFSLLNKIAAAARVQAYNNTPADKRPAFLEQIRKRFGPEKSQIIMRDLSKAGLPKSGIVMNSFVGNTDHGGTLSSLLANRNKIDKKDIKALLPSDTVKAIRKQIDKDIAEYKAGIIAANPGNATIMGTYTETLNKIAQMKFLTNEEEGPEAAAKTVVDMAVTSQNQILVSNESAPRFESFGRVLPKFNIVLNKKFKERSMFIRMGIASSKESLRKFEPQISLGPGFENASEKKKTEQILKVLQEGGRWVTNDTADGAVFLDPSGVPVINKRGERKTFKFDTQDLAGPDELVPIKDSSLARAEKAAKKKQADDKKLAAKRQQDEEDAEPDDPFDFGF